MSERQFTTLLDELRGKRTSSMTEADKTYAKHRDKYRGCPHLAEDSICEPSRKFRLSKFPCNGFMYQTCSVYLLIKNNQDDPTVLIRGG